MHEIKMWDIKIEWTEGEHSVEEMRSAQDFVVEIEKNVNEDGDDDVPSCIKSITFTRAE